MKKGKEMIRIVTMVLATFLVVNVAQANEKRQVVVSKFKHQAKTITPLSITEFEVKDKNGNTKIVNLKGQKFVVVSVSEPGSEGKSYAVDEDGTIWWVDKISSGAYGGHETPNGVFPVILKRRYHMSAAHPSSNGVNNMDFEMLFTNQGHALHLGNTKALSHGCIHIGRKDVEAMFKWVDTHTKVVITRGHYAQFLNAELKSFQNDIKAYDRSH
ncbi:MAG: L,D-transpeptidase [Epsilonproteobacteria bacterium]|nr:MAG: L,D-transpeptidase [Campylobacterota bacterium]